jgi:hypothetical protein
MRLLSLAEDTDSVIRLAPGAWMAAVTLGLLQATSVTSLADTLPNTVC